MKTKLIIIAIILFFSNESYASLNINQAKTLAEEAYTRGDFNGLYSLGKILYEDGKYEEGEALLSLACEEGKIMEACSYYKNISSRHTQENKSVNNIDSNQKLISLANEYKRGDEFYEKKTIQNHFQFSLTCVYMKNMSLLVIC